MNNKNKRNSQYKSDCDNGQKLLLLITCSECQLLMTDANQENMWIIKHETNYVGFACINARIQRNVVHIIKNQLSTDILLTSTCIKHNTDCVAFFVQ